VRATVSASGAAGLVVVGRRGWLKDRGWAIRARVGRDGWARAAHTRGVRLCGESRRCTRARLGHLVAHVRRDVHATHVGEV
jgi:hypothetical protein